MTDQDQARQIAERVARRVRQSHPNSPGQVPQKPTRNGAPVREEISAIREGLHDLESKLERIESKIVNGSTRSGEPSRARVIDFVSSGPPLRSAPSIAQPSSIEQTSPEVSSPSSAEFFQFVPATTSPWLSSMSSMLGNSPQPAIRNPQSAAHPSQERFGVEEATVKELVEFFESEKKCAVEPGAKPCDHCAMCNSRGF